MSDAHAIPRRRGITVICLITCWFGCTAAYAQEPSPIKVGATLSLSGSFAFWGESVRQGMELAVGDINAAGGLLGRRLKVVYEDFGELNLDRVASGVHRLLTVEKIPVIFTQWSEDTEVAWPIAHRRGALTINVSAGSEHITRGRTLISRISPGEGRLSEYNVRYALRRGAKVGCMIIDQAPYFLSLAEAAQKEWRRLSGGELLSFATPAGSQDFRTIFQRVKRAKCDAIFFLQLTSSVESALRQSREAGVTAAYFVTQSTILSGEVRRQAGAALEGAVAALYSPPTAEFLARFRQHYSKEADLWAAYGYDALQALARAVQGCGSLDAHSLAQQLRNLKPFAGASGEVRLDGDGDRLPRSIDFWIVRRGVPAREGESGAVLGE